MLAKEIATKKKVAVKHMKIKVSSHYQLKKALREVHIQRKLSEMEGGSLHFPVLYDVILDTSNKGYHSVFFVMEYFKQNLRTFISSGVARQMEAAQIVKILY